MPCAYNVSRGNADSIYRRSFSCDDPVDGLNQIDCEWMSTIGMAGQGQNPTGDNGIFWIGDDGPNTLTFYNEATNPSPVPVTLIMWYDAPNTYTASFVAAYAPLISYSLPDTGDSVTISVANGVSGAWAALNDHVSDLTVNGQVNNTWGEFTTGEYATVDISREVNMVGNTMSLTTSGGCNANLDTCAYACISGNTCYTAGSYELLNCLPGSQPYAAGQMVDGVPTGGCQGWSNDGSVDIELGRY